MKSKLIAAVLAALTLTPGANAASGDAQDVAVSAVYSSGRATRPDKSIQYHGGQVMHGNSNVYFIWYGCWSNALCGSANQADTMAVLTDFVTRIGSSPYFQINAGYPDQNGYAPTGSLVFGGAVADASYSRGAALTEADVEGLVADQLATGGLPVDPRGIYVVLTSSDVTLTDPAAQFCLTCCTLHGFQEYFGSRIKSVFVGNPARCPGQCAAQFASRPSPNANYVADAMASWLANAMSATITNPHGDAWYDGRGLENAEKCEGQYGQTFAVTNPDGVEADANVRMGSRNYLLQQNWVNGRRGHCAIAYDQ